MITRGFCPAGKEQDMTKKEIIEKAKSEANSPKDRLISILDELENAGATRDAKKLEKIIVMLELWQNS